MTLHLLREKPFGTFQFGVLFVDGKFQFFTLENNDKKIPVGDYPISFYSSPKFGLTVPLLNVPGHSFIEIHPANYPYELEGCIAVGVSKTDELLSESRKAFFALMKMLSGHKDISIKVSSSDY